MVHYGLGKNITDPSHYSPIHHDACQADQFRMVPTIPFMPCHSSSRPAPEPGKETSQRQILPVHVLYIPWHNESGIPAGNAASDSVTSASLRCMPHHSPTFLAVIDEYGKGFYSVQSNPHTDRERFACKKYRLIHNQLPPKKGGQTGYDGFRRILGTKIHVAADGTGLPIPIRASPANVHDSTKFIDVSEDISEPAGDGLIRQIISAYADRGYDVACIRDYLGWHGIDCCIPYKRNSRNVAQNRNQKHYGKTRFVVERFFAWLKCGLYGTAARYERNCDNYLGFVYLACIMMHWRVLG